ncbi:class I SAM-dependent DNA methyltransferase [Streptomyces longisporoflavus]|uniref:Class I SAM-dependent DNA methyltransferase n=1 Tax=Streptomyces longisporoflavus TaxID=28044 RepID=A0ABW7R3W4_9ACTN
MTHTRQNTERTLPVPLSDARPARRLTAGDWDRWYARGGGWPRVVSDAEAERFCRFVGPVPGGSAVDLGCGTGHWARQLAAWGKSVRGYDWSGEAIRQATCRSTGTTTQFETRDLNRQPLPGIRPGSVDLVTCRFAIAYLDQARLMADVGSWLTWNGTLFVLTRIDEPGALVHDHHRGVSRQQLDQLADGWAHHQVHRISPRGTALVLRRYTG